MTATEYGSLNAYSDATFTFPLDLSDKGILAQLQNLADREIIDKQHINKIYRKNIREFLFSPLGIRIQKQNHCKEN